MKSAVVCLGAVNVDQVYRVETLEPFTEVVPDLRPGGEYAIAPSQEAQLQSRLEDWATFSGRTGGGQAANTAFALARWGIPVAMVGRVGEDEDGDFLRQGLVGVNCHLQRQGRSGRAYILVDLTGERTILIAPHTNNHLALTDIPLKLIQEADFLHLTSFVGLTPLKVQIALVGRLAEGPQISLDPGDLYSRRGRSALEPLLARIDTLLVTAPEWRRLGGDMYIRPSWAPETVLLKLGPQGARLLTPTGATEIPGETVATVVDTLGAGDVFAAGWLAGRHAGLDPRAAVRLANRAAAFSLGGRGRERYPNKKFLVRQLNALR